MLSAFPKYIKKWSAKGRAVQKCGGGSGKRRLFAAMITAGITGVLFLTGCQDNRSGGQDQAFQKFTKEVFCQETASNTISLHYTLKNPEEYGIEQAPVTFGNFEMGAESIRASVENMRQALDQFDYDKLSVQNRLTYDVLDYYLEISGDSAEYVLYEEPLGLVSGVQTQLPVVLSEYQFYDEEDVRTYLELMKTTPEYFQSLIEFEQKKSEAGLFMSDDAAQQVMEQCEAFLSMGESNYLISTFAERVTQMDGLTEKEKSDYIQKNALILNNYVFPAYSRLEAAVQKLMGTGTNEKGLCYLPEGKEYYELVVRESTGSSRSVSEIKALTMQQIIDDLEAMEAVLGIDVPGEETGTEQNAISEEETGAEQGTISEEATGGEQDAAAEGNSEKSEGGNAEIGTDEEAAELARAMSDKINLAVETASMETVNPVTILNNLEEEITKAFPEPPETTVSVKYVPEAMEEHLSPAFYMIPAIDNYGENVIYVNQAHMGNTLTLFTTLAHEGYPGHLYQTVYYAATEPDPLRNVFNFGGYVEGWATYAEMCSYSLAPLTKEQAVLLQRNSSIILGLYSLADIGIHYEGWGRMDTFSFFSNYGITDSDTVNRIYDLIIGSPGNYLKYYIGYVEFLELKKEWAAEKGEAFSQKEFHEAVLSVGPAPFELVEEYMWKMGESRE